MDRTERFTPLLGGRTLVLALACTLNVSIGCTAQDVSRKVLVEPLTPLEQLSGDWVQMEERSTGGDPVYARYHTHGLAESRYGVWGFDETPCVDLGNGYVFCVTGDAVTSYKDGGGNRASYSSQQCSSGRDGTGAKSLCLGLDVMMLLPSDMHPERCSWVSRTDRTLAAEDSKELPYENCPTPLFIVDRSHGSSVPKAAFIQDRITHLDPDDNTLDGYDAGSTFIADSRLYLTYHLKRQTPSDPLHFSDFYSKSGLFDMGDPLKIGPEAPPEEIAKKYALSEIEIPHGTAAIAGDSATVTGAGFDAAWAQSNRWQGIDINHVLYRIAAVSAEKTKLTVSCGSQAEPACPKTSGSFAYDIIPEERTSTGKFMRTSWVIQKISEMPLGVADSLPFHSDCAALVYGTSWNFRRSNVYLGIADCHSIGHASYLQNSGLSNVWYWTGIDKNGKPAFKLGDERSAAPLLSTWNNSKAPCVGEFSVQFHPSIGMYLMTYGQPECHGQQMRNALVPWGAWSVEEQIFASGTDLFPFGERLIACTGCSTSFAVSPTLFPALLDPLMPPGCKGPACAVWNTEAHVFSCIEPGVTTCKKYTEGASYAPHQYPPKLDHLNPDGSVTIFLNISTWNPYQVFLGSVKIRRP